MYVRLLQLEQGLVPTAKMSHPADSVCSVNGVSRIIYGGVPFVSVNSVYKKGSTTSLSNFEWPFTPENQGF